MSCHIRLLSAHTIPPPLSHVGTGGSTWGRAPASLSNVAFRAEPKKQCINTTLFLNEKSVYKHCFCRVARRRPTKKTVFIHGFVLGRCCATREKTCLYTVLSFMDKVVFIHSFFGSARNAALRRLLPASCSLLLFPPLVRTAWFPPLAPTDLSHGFSTILAKHKTDQTEPPKHNTHLVFFEFGFSCILWIPCEYRHEYAGNSLNTVNTGH